MQRRKALQERQRQAESVKADRMLAEIRQRDKERIVFFRQMGEIADRYAWKGIHGGEVRRKLLAQQKPMTGKNRPIRPIVFQKHSMVPFPDSWMRAVFRVIYW